MKPPIKILDDACVNGLSSAVKTKTLKKMRATAYDPFGPFPDEPLLTSIDRVLFFLGGGTMKNYFNAKFPSSCSEGSESSVRATNKELNFEQKESGVNESFGNQPLVQNAACPKCVACSRRITSSHCTPNSCRFPSSRLDSPSSKVNELFNDSYLSKSVQTLKKSFSLCSLACRKLKERFTMSKESKEPRWLWTKLQDHGGTCQIYEVFMNSTVASHPTQFETENAPRIIFVILPTGIIMPFETFPQH